MVSELILRRAARVLRRGGVIAYPTEAVFGLGCDPRCDMALREILRIKGRSARSGFILIAGGRDKLTGWIAPTAVEERRLVSESAQPVTWIVTAAARTPGVVRGGRATIAVRLTRHPLAARLSELLAGPLVSTSANRHGRPPARTALQVRRRFGATIDCIVPGATSGLSRPTEIRDASTGRVLRRG